MNNKSDRLPRNPFVFLFLRAMFKWEVAQCYGKADKTNAARYYICYSNDFDIDGKLIPLSIQEISEIESQASYFIRDMFERVEDLSFTEEMLNELVRSVKLYHVTKLKKDWASFNEYLEKHPDALWITNQLKEYNKYSKLPKGIKDELKIRVNKYVANQTAQQINLAKLRGEDFRRSFAKAVEVNSFQVIRTADRNDFFSLSRFFKTINKEKDCQYIEDIITVLRNTVWIHTDVYNYITAVLIVAAVKDELFEKLLTGYTIEPADNVLDIHIDVFSKNKSPTYELTSKNLTRIFISNFVFHDNKVRNVVIEKLPAIFKSRGGEICRKKMKIGWSITGKSLDIAKLGFTQVRKGWRIYVVESNTFCKLHKKVFEIKF